MLPLGQIVAKHARRLRAPMNMLHGFGAHILYIRMQGHLLGLVILIPKNGMFVGYLGDDKKIVGSKKRFRAL